MKSKKVGKIKRVIYDPDLDKLDLVIEILDDRFKKEFLNNFMLSGNLSITNRDLIFMDIDEDEDNA